MFGLLARDVAPQESFHLLLRDGPQQVVDAEHDAQHVGPVGGDVLLDGGCRIAQGPTPQGVVVLVEVGVLVLDVAVVVVFVLGRVLLRALRVLALGGRYGQDHLRCGRVGVGADEVQPVHMGFQVVPQVVTPGSVTVGSLGHGVTGEHDAPYLAHWPPFGLSFGSPVVPACCQPKTGRPRRHEKEDEESGEEEPTGTTSSGQEHVQDLPLRRLSGVEPEDGSAPLGAVPSVPCHDTVADGAQTLHGDRDLLSDLDRSDPRRCTGEDHVSGEQRHERGDVRDDVRDVMNEL